MLYERRSLGGLVWDVHVTSNDLAVPSFNAASSAGLCMSRYLQFIHLLSGSCFMGMVRIHRSCDMFGIFL